MEKRVKPYLRIKPEVLAERKLNAAQIIKRTGHVEALDRDGHTLWQKPAAYDWDFWTVENKNQKQNLQDYINEVFVECGEVKSVLCIDHDKESFTEYVWDDSGKGAVVFKVGTVSVPKKRVSDSVLSAGSGQEFLDTSESY